MSAIPTVKINAFLREAHRRGLDPRHLLGSKGLSIAQFAEPRRRSIEFHNVKMALTALAQVAPPDFAAKLGSQWSVKDFGIVGYGLLTYGQFGTFVDRWLRCMDYLGHALLFESVVDHENWYLVITPREPLPDAAFKLCVEEACAQVFPVYRELTGQMFRPVRIDVALPRQPGDKFLSSPLCNVPVAFDAAATRLVMRRGDRDTHIKITPEDLIAACNTYCDQILPAAIDGPYPLPQVRERLLLSCGRPEQVGEIAQRLNLSKRSLNRYLAKLGWTHSQLVHQYRRDYAFELLRTKQFCIKEVAFMVGFDSAGSLQRAFRQWSGVSVGQWARTCSTTPGYGTEGAMAPH